MAHYHIKYGNKDDNFLEIEYKISVQSHNILFIQLPAWRPGRYELGNFAQNMFTLFAHNEKGQSITCKKISKDRWEIKTDGSEEITFKYKYAAVIKNAGGTFKSDNQLVITPVNCLIYAEQLINESCGVSIDMPVDFDLATSMETTMEVNSFYELAATPIVCGSNIKRVSYQVNGINFHICIEGNVAPDFDKIVKDFKKFTEDQLELFGDFPCKDYYYLILIFDEKHYHGVEHLNSTLIALGPDSEFVNHKFYLNLLGISSHELFHFWNICRIRPKEMLPYDYTGENYFETGYIAEGVTTYYGDYIMGRSKTITEEEFLAEISTTVTRHLLNTGRDESSLASSSLELWLDGYKQGVKGRKVSIYAKGATIALMLDLWIRKTTTCSLDDVMRLMWEHHGKTGVGYTTADYKSYVEQVAGVSMDWYFDDYVTGTKRVDELLNELLEFVGLELKEETYELKEEKKQRFVLKKLPDLTEGQLQSYNSWVNL